MKKKSTGTPVPIMALVTSFLCPTELSLFVAGLRLPPHRVALLVLLPLAVARLVGQRNLRIQSFDYLLSAFALWLTLIYTHHHGFEGFVYGGSMALECLGGYLVARVYIRTEQDYRSSVRFMFYAVMTAAAIALLDSLSGDFFIHHVLRQWFGGDPLPPMQFRGGLARAASVFDHPIHYGTFCAVMLAIYWSVEKGTGRAATRAGLVTFATLLGMSSAPLLSILLQSSLLVWEKVTRSIANRTTITLTAVAGVFVGIALASTRGPVQIIATSFTLDSWTGYYRTQIWEHGLDNVWANALFGIGLNDWARPEWMVSPTVDAFWLVTAMRSGIPGFLLMLVPIVLIARGVNRRAIWGNDQARRRLARGWMISLVSLCLVAATVHFWNVVQAYFFFLVGLGGWLADPVRSRAAKPVRREADVFELADPGSPAAPGYAVPGGYAPPRLPLPA